MTKKPDPTICKSKQLLVNDFIDNRMTDIEREDFLRWIQNCHEQYNCNICSDRIQSFSSLKVLCKELAIHVQTPSDIVSKIKTQLY
ncbi:MAG: hypothetical protein PHI40_06505 [Caldisericia bacterium]|nr:hypothetical protein [Caldisericia bacterium]MDD4615038.1 hypothetical protein [Caldisericia bacterium]